MRKISAQAFGSQLKGGLKSGSVIVLAGDNEAVKRELFRAALDALGLDLNDAFQVARLSSGDLATDLGRFADEVGAISMFGGLRAVEAVCAPKQAESALAVAQSLGRTDCIVFIHVAGADFEFPPELGDSPDFICVDCPADTAASLTRTLDHLLAQADLRLDGAARAALISLIGGQRAGLHLEVDKLAAYAKDSAAPLTERDVREAVADNATLAYEDAAKFALSGDLRSLCAAIDRMRFQRLDAGAALMAGARALSSLHRGKLKNWSFTRDAPGAQLTEPELRRLNRMIAEAVGAARADTVQGTMKAERALISLANQSRKKQR